jgi:hypothetical protein
MLALARSRGYATMDHEDWSIVRVVMGAASREPGWPGPADRPRLLVEAPGGRWQGEDEARAAGLQVVVCPGPTARRRPCPALAGERCPLAAGADAILVARPPADGPWAELPEAHLAVHPGVPVCLQPRLGRAGAADAEHAPAGVVVVPAGDERALVALARRAVEGHASSDDDGGGGDEPASS